MTLQQLKAEAAALSDADRLALQAFLIHLARVDDPSHRRALSQRLQRLEADGGIPLDEFILLNATEEPRAT